MKELNIQRIKNIANSLDELFRKEGGYYIPAGKNGPYNQSETNIRNIVNSLSLFSYLNIIGLMEIDKVNNIFSYLLSYLNDKPGKIFHLRKIENQFDSNGVIGPAWCLEALAIYRSINGAKYSIEATKLINFIISKLRINKKDNLLFFDKISKTDYCLNHNLWLLASLVLAGEKYFLDKNTKLLNDILRYPFSSVRSKGYIRHYIFKNNYKGLKTLFINQTLNRKKNNLRETGYHLYNIRPLLILNYYLERNIYIQSFIEKSIPVLNTDFFNDELVSCSKYSYLYNSPYFLSYLYSLKNKECYTKYIKNNLRIQLQNKQEEQWSSTDNLYIRNIPDFITFNCRAYESFLPDHL